MTSQNCEWATFCCINASAVATTLGQLGLSHQCFGSGKTASKFYICTAEWDATVDGVRYVQAALCYPQERSMRAKSIAIGPKPGVGQQPLEVWDGPALLPYQRVAYWSTYYATHERTPENTNDLAPYVARA